MDYRNICLSVCDIARETGEYIAGQRKNFSFSDVEFKGSQNMVSYVDKQAERMIVEKLRALTPGAGYITEEGTVSRNDRGNDARNDKEGDDGRDVAQNGRNMTWIIDPLDGTTNFIHGLPPYCVSIGLMEEGEMVIGVVYEITLGEMFCAWKGSKAYLDGKEINASAIDKMENALIAIGFAYVSDAEIDASMNSALYYQKNTNGFRRIGSATADLVYVACGRFDAFCQTKLAPWDVAAGAFIAKAAGAAVTDYRGGNDYIFGKEIIASNPHIYDEFCKTIK